MGNFLTSALKTRLPQRGSFVANVLTLMTGNTLAQGLLVAAAPVLTRLYSPEDFGVLAIFMSMSTILSVVVGLRYEMAIMLPDEDEDAASVLVLTVLITLGISFLVLVGVALFRHPIANLLKTPEMAPWLWWVPLNIMIMGFYHALTYWASRKKRFQNLAISRASQSLSGVGVQMGAGFFMHAGGMGLIAGQLTGNLASAGVLGGQIWREVWEKISNALTMAKLKEQALRYRKFPQYSALNGLLDTGSQMLPLLLFSYFFGTLVLGHYFLARRILSTPLSILGQALSQVFFQKASEHHNKSKNLKSLVLKSYKSLFLIVIFPALVLFIGAPVIFETVFGGDWRLAGNYCQLILPWIIILFIVSPATVIFSIYNKQDLALLYGIISFISRLTAILFGALVLQSAIYTIGLYGLIGLLINLVMGLNIVYITSNRAH